MTEHGPSRFLRLTEVQRISGLSRSSIYKQMREGRFPRRIPLGPATAAWLEDEVEARQRARIAAAPPGGWTPPTLPPSDHPPAPPARNPPRASGPLRPTGQAHPVAPMPDPDRPPDRGRPQMMRRPTAFGHWSIRRAFSFRA